MTILCMNEIAWLAQHSKWPATEHATLIAVAWAESKGNTDAIGTNASTKQADGAYAPLSASQDLGLMQVNNYWHAANKMVDKGLDWRDPADNLELARLAWLEAKSSWTAWSTFKNGAHLPFMPGAATALKAPLAPWAVTDVVVQLTAIEQLADAQAAQIANLAASLSRVAKHFA